jgi:polar amino acid transport system substrate-binding protein
MKEFWATVGCMPTKRTMPDFYLLCRAVLLSAALLLGAHTAVRADGPSFVFCYQASEMYPNYTGDGASVPTSKPGIVVELLQEVTNRAGLNLRLVRYPWKRCMALMKAGRVDSIIASYRKERLGAVVYPMKDGVLDKRMRVASYGYFLYQKSDQPNYWDGEKFSDPTITIGAPLGFSITAVLKEKGLNIVEAGATTGLVEMLHHGRIQAFAGPGTVSDALIRNNRARYKDIIRVDAPLKVNPYFVVFSHQFYDARRRKAEEIWQYSSEITQEYHDEIAQKY